MLYACRPCVHDHTRTYIAFNATYWCDTFYRIKWVHARVLAQLVTMSILFVLLQNIISLFNSAAIEMLYVIYVICLCVRCSRHYNCPMIRLSFHIIKIYLTFVSFCHPLLQEPWKTLSTDLVSFQVYALLRAQKRLIVNYEFFVNWWMCLCIV